MRWHKQRRGRYFADVLDLRFWVEQDDDVGNPWFWWISCPRSYDEEIIIPDLDDGLQVGYATKRQATAAALHWLRRFVAAATEVDRWGT